MHKPLTLLFSLVLLFLVLAAFRMPLPPVGDPSGSDSAGRMPARGNDIPPGFYLPKVDFATGMLPNTVALGDLDGDNKPDMVTANYNSGTVSVLRNTSAAGSISTASFATAVDFNTGTNPFFVSISDIDGDGKKDLVVSNFSSGTVSVLRNTATSGNITTSSFAGKVDFGTGTNPAGLAIGDLNGDGKPEIVVTNAGSNTISIFQNAAVAGSITASSFNPKIDFTTGANPRSVVISNLNSSDTKPDLVVANQNSNTVSVFRNIAFGSTITTFFYDQKVDFTTGTSPVSVLTSDIDRDFRPDIIVANNGSASVWVLPNRISSANLPFGPASFPGAYAFAVGTMPSFIAAGDINGDQIADIICSNAGSNNIAVLQNTSAFGNTTFAPRADFTTTSSPLSVAISKLTGDSLPEVVTSNVNNSVSIFKVNPQFLTPVPPVITSFSPLSAPANTFLSITGSNFNVDAIQNVVIFGAAKSRSEGASGNLLFANVAPGALYQPVSVLNTATGLTGYSSQPFLPTFNNAPGMGFYANFFQPKVNFPAGQLPYTMALGDLDGDGKNDMAVVNANSNTVSILRNTSSSGSINTTSFAEKVDFPTPNAPRTVMIADLDGDAKPEIIVVNAGRNEGTGSNTISVWHNISVTGSITTSSFTNRIDFTVGNFDTPYSVAVGDMNRDGRPDLVVANSDRGTVGILRNTTVTGTINATSFAGIVEFRAGVRPRSVAVSDLDNDGMPDIAVANEGSNNVSVLRNTTEAGSNGPFSFAAKVDFNAGLQPPGIAAGDVDGDGRLDLVVVNLGSNTVSVLRNLSVPGKLDATSFAAKIDFPTGSSPFSLALGDVNGDRKVDITVVNANSNTVSVLRNTSVAGSVDASSFASKVDFGTGVYPIYVVVGDLDGDSQPEICFANAAENNVSVLSGNAFPLPPVINAVSPGTARAGTGVTITGTRFNPVYTSNTVYFGAVKAAVISGSSTSLSVTVPPGATYQPVSVLNNETGLTGYASLSFSTAFTTPFGNTLPANFYLPGVEFPTGNLPRAVTLGDLDNEGRPELVVANQQDNTVSVFRNTSVSGTVNASSFAAKFDLPTGTGPFSVVTSDVDGDGRPDIIVANYTAGTISILHNKFAGGMLSQSSFAARVDVQVGSQSYPFSFAVSDLNLDGKPELITANSYRNTVSVFLNMSAQGSIETASFAAPVEFSTGAFPRYVAVGDVNGDRKPDLVVANQNAGTVSVLRNFISNSRIELNSFAEKIDFTVGADPSAVAIGDLNRDSQPDLAVANYSSGTVTILRNMGGGNGVANFSAGIHFLTAPNPYFMLIADANGDGRPDILTANAASNTLSILRNTADSGSITAGSFAAKADFNTGGYPVSAALGDVDGDGIAEAITANAAGTVSVFRINLQQSMTAVAGEPFLLQSQADTETGGDMRLYPNPFKGELTLRLLHLKSSVTSIDILNDAGKTVKKFSVNPDGKASSLTMKLNLKGQPAGVYYVKVTSGEGVKIGKVVLQR